MQSFLSRVLDDALQKDSDLKASIFVLPNKRSSLFLRQELKRRLKPNSFFPEILSIEEFMEDLSGCRVLDSVGLLFEFYSIYGDVVPKESKNNFESFSKWAQVLLQDFNELDSSMADAQSILSYIYEARRIENWTVGETEPNELIDNYVSFHKLIPKFYRHFQERMDTMKAGYQGYVYRRACESIQGGSAQLKSQQIIFAGFNALSRSEEWVIQELLDIEKASIYWDDDLFYARTESSAGAFIRNYKNRWTHYQKNAFKWTENGINSIKKVHLHALPKNISQIKHTAEILETLMKEGSLSNTALVLGNEKLLPALLNSLPREVREANITMGYELQNVALSIFFDSLFRAQQNRSARRGSGSFYYKDLQNVLKDKHVRMHCQIDDSFEKNWNRLVYEEKRLFISEKEVMELSRESTRLEELFELLFTGWDSDINALLEKLSHITEWFRSHNSPDRLETEMLFRFHTIFKQLLSYNETYTHISSLESLYEFYRQLLQMEKMSFQGEPLSGLQIMGLLESRVLDFENVILTSVNEGFLPSGGTDRSFIPMDIKFEKGLPTFREKEAIFSYHFFRLFHRAKRIFLVYNSVSDDFGAGEPSRFIKQLEIASKLGVLDQVSFEKKSIQPKAVRNPLELKVIKKTEGVLSKINESGQKGFSPTALTTYIRNPLDYYKRYVLGIQESVQVEESIAANTFGTIVHNTLESLYKPHLKKWLQPELIEIMQKQVDQVIRSEWAATYSSKAAISGKNLLSFEIAKKFISEFLEMEKEFLKLGNRVRILALEQEISCHHHIAGIDREIRLKGTIDRVDEVNGIRRIVDYKTGKVKPTDMKISNWDLLVSEEKYSKAFQVLTYAYMYLKQNSKRESQRVPDTQFDEQVNINTLESGIISFKNLRSGFMKFNEHTLSEDVLQSYLQQLDALLLELFDKHIPFSEKEIQPFSY